LSWSNVTISSSQIGHTRLDEEAAAPLAGRPRLIFDARSCEVDSGSGLEEGGDMELGELKETVLLSDGAKGLAARGAWAGGGGARPLPLPRILPPPSLRLDMTSNLLTGCGQRIWGRGEPCDP